jgi:hypothetical protein
MSWEYVIIAAVLLLGIYAFVVLTDLLTRWFLSHGSSPPADATYGNYATQCTSSGSMPGSRAESGRTARAPSLATQPPPTRTHAARKLLTTRTRQPVEPRSCSRPYPYPRPPLIIVAPADAISSAAARSRMFLMPSWSAR